MTPTSRLKRHSTVESWVRHIIAAFVLVLSANSFAHSQGANSETGSMVHYAMIFRSQRVLTVDQQQQREAEIQAWAKRVRDRGVILDPKILGGTDIYLEADGDNVVSRPGSDTSSSLGAIIFFDAASKGQAIEVARSHPALRYGVTIELREWQAPPVPPATKR